jgi:hypothetical protein
MLSLLTKRLNLKYALYANAVSQHISYYIALFIWITRKVVFFREMVWSHFESFAPTKLKDHRIYYGATVTATELSHLLRRCRNRYGVALKLTNLPYAKKVPSCLKFSSA